jgi:hypothetical protein
LAIAFFIVASHLSSGFRVHRKEKNGTPVAAFSPAFSQLADA